VVLNDTEAFETARRAADEYVTAALLDEVSGSGERSLHGFRGRLRDSLSPTG